MPLIKSAIKKLRKDKKRTASNLVLKRRYKKWLKKALAKPTKKAIEAAVSAIDKAAKRNIIHKNKAARLKSRVMKVTAETRKEKETRKKTATTKTWKKREVRKK